MRNPFYLDSLGILGISKIDWIVLENLSSWPPGSHGHFENWRWLSWNGWKLLAAMSLFFGLASWVPTGGVAICTNESKLTLESKRFCSRISANPRWKLSGWR